MNNRIFNEPFVKLPLNTALAYGIAHVARPYLHLNPMNVALFSLGTILANKMGKELVKFVNEQWNRSRYHHLQHAFAGRSITTIAIHAPAIYTVAKGIFSPIQAVAALGLTTATDRLYYMVTGYNPNW